MPDQVWDLFSDPLQCSPHPSGINLAFARLLLDRQCNVVFADLALRPEAAELVAKHASSSETSAKAVFQKTDVRNWAELEEMFNVADRAFGGADIVCPGAGVFEPVCTPYSCRIILDRGPLEY